MPPEEDETSSSEYDNEHDGESVKSLKDHVESQHSEKQEK